MPRVKSCAPKAFPENGDNQKFWITLSRKSSIYLKWLAFQHVPASLTVGTVVPVKAVLLPFTNKARACLGGRLGAFAIVLRYAEVL